MTMSEAALRNDAAIGVPLVEVSSIFIDHEFNCRGWFSPTDCVDLAKDIAEHGLQQPIIVRPVTERDPLSVRNKYKYVTIAGHRRLFSYKINNAELIPAIIKDASITDFAARDINAVENLHRKDLSLWQEALAIRHYVNAGWPEQEIVERINKSRGWVQIRVMLLKMPEEIQQAAHQGFLSQENVRELYKYKDKGKQLKAAGILVDKKKRGDKRDLFADIRRKEPKRALEKRARKRDEIFDMIFKLQAALNGRPPGSVDVANVVTVQGNFIGTRLLSWAAGEITNLEIERDIKHFCGVFGVGYEIPEFTVEV